jgi:hypothetical protein
MSLKKIYMTYSAKQQLTSIIGSNVPSIKNYFGSQSERCFKENFWISYND